MSETSNNIFGGNLMTKSPLANKLKSLRVESNISTPVLAAQFGVSPTHIHYLENDKRGISNELLTKYANFFHVPFEDLKELQNNSQSIIKNIPIDSSADTAKVDDFISLILSVEEPLRDKFITDCTQKLHEMFFTLLTPYGLNDLKKYLTNLRDSWYSIGDADFTEHELSGNLKLPEHEMYFKLSIKENVCFLELLHEDHRKIEYFTKWLTQPDSTIIHNKKIPHLEENQKVKTFYWFSPKFTENDHFLFIKEQHDDLTQIYCQSYKLDLMIKNYLKNEDPDTSS
ncbi:helix-turn-helix transcriptional regulator [Metabacillus litoralis]|uniref:helix-turn-helix transcriptional regulator n=1 Tax=Metabacillus litoralis TaxID=152268 RepID=UPI00203E2657|nr:helix-turn-helix transcriptional regulator [Metabacillus litoralis]MCM3162722.1 helix-turn-helix domain-containing protein [Metabacillus litoralis]